DAGEADVAAEGEPRRRGPQAVEEAAVAAERDRIPRLLAAVAVDEAAAGGREVALVAAHRAGLELELRVGAGDGRGERNEKGERAHQSSLAPARIQFSIRQMSASGIAWSGGIFQISRPRRSFSSGDLWSCPGRTNRSSVR